MFSTILSGAIFGIRSYLVHVEVDLSSGLPCFVMVGRLGGEVKESGERVRIALKNTGIVIPPMHISVNLSPADLKKEGTGFDLAIAVGVLTAMEKLPYNCADELLILGELGLNGEVKPVRGVLPVALCAVREGVKKCLVPKENVREAAAAAGMKVVGISCLGQVIDYLRCHPGKRDALLPAEEFGKEELLLSQDIEGRNGNKGDFAEIVGQEGAKRAALIAAAGFHHMLIIGPPGAGKTMIAKCMPSILPPLSLEESLEISSIYSISGNLPAGSGLLTQRPFLSPHHTISPQALSGGGKIPKPGVISLAHRGVLFLDELPEFKRQTLDLLRQPLEERQIQIARTGGSFAYPADVMLVGAMNPCPCGYYPDRNRCRCTPFEVHHYLSHISGPILDRIDLCTNAAPVEINQLHSRKRRESSKDMREKVMRARKQQEIRYRGSGYRFNSEIAAGDLESYCHLEKEEMRMMEKLFGTLLLSARAYHKLLKVARTIADLEQSDRIMKKHLMEAVCYQTGDKIGRQLGGKG
ncbi:MAG: YifB family Mg chelatase-like AAA ATPase [Lachnospiraceae bacterium]|nr:YifB family Mg chelatase-like AAA ATPase [Lachnospiraceae bacterium]